MATIFADLDGVTFQFGTNEFVPGALEKLREFQKAGNQIVFITRRDGVFFPLGDTAEVLSRMFPGSALITNVSSPRIIINNEGAAAINHVRDAAWVYDLFSIASAL